MTQDIILGIKDVTPEYKATVESRAKELGFSTVSDYLTHLVLADKTKPKQKYTRKSTPKSEPSPHTYTLDDVKQFCRDVSKVIREIDVNGDCNHNAIVTQDLELGIDYNLILGAIEDADESPNELIIKLGLPESNIETVRILKTTDPLKYDSTYPFHEMLMTLNDEGLL